MQRLRRTAAAVALAAGVALVAAAAGHTQAGDVGFHSAAGGWNVVADRSGAGCVRGAPSCHVAGYWPCTGAGCQETALTPNGSLAMFCSDIFDPGSGNPGVSVFSSTNPVAAWWSTEPNAFGQYDPSLPPAAGEPPLTLDGVAATPAGWETRQQAPQCVAPSTYVYDVQHAGRWFRIVLSTDRGTPATLLSWWRWGDPGPDPLLAGAGALLLLAGAVAAARPRIGSLRRRDAATVG